MRRDEMLTAFLREAAAEPFRFGTWDCAMTLANWVERVTLRDPAASLRGRYRTRLGFVRIVKRAGGLVALVDALAARAGLQVTEAPAPGDIAIVATEIGPLGAIKVPRGFMVKVTAGIIVRDFEPRKAWSV